MTEDGVTGDAAVLGAGVPDAPTGGWRTATVSGVRRPIQRSVQLRLDVHDRIDHLPGQHYVVRLTAEDGYTAQRSYSVASAPGDPLVELFVERLDDGEVSTYLADVVEPGDELEVRGPIGGWFVWDGETPALLVGRRLGRRPVRVDAPARARPRPRGPAEDRGLGAHPGRAALRRRAGGGRRAGRAHPRGPRHPAGRPAARRGAAPAVGAGPDHLRLRVDGLRGVGDPAARGVGPPAGVRSGWSASGPAAALPEPARGRDGCCRPAPCAVGSDGRRHHRGAHQRGAVPGAVHAQRGDRGGGQLGVGLLRR